MMFFSMFSLLAFSGILLINLAIPICIAVYVYQDAKKRGMEPILWALVAAVIPSFIGLIIYLMMRSGHSALHCAKCGAAVEENYAVCPQCGTDLQTRCPSCGRYVQPDWHLCANCGTALAEPGQVTIIEQPSNNRGLWILLAAVAVFAVLFLLGALVFNFAVVPHGGSMMVHHL